MKFKVKNRKNYDRKEPSSDYLKYWRIVKQWAKYKYKLASPDIEMLLFLYSEKLFTRKDFDEFNQVMSWDKNRFYRLLNEGWIIIWRERNGRQAKLYEVSFKGKRICASIYKKLNMEEQISEDRRRNPIFKKTSSYAEKVYRRMIKKMNLEIKEKSQNN